MHPDDLIEAFRKEVRHEMRRVSKERQTVLGKFPFVTAILVSVGGIATITGLSRLIDRVDYLNRNPWLLLAFGMFILLITGTVYRKLGR